MVFCRFCNTTYDHDDKNDRYQHDIKCNAMDREQKYKSMLEELNIRKRKITHALGGSNKKLSLNTSSEDSNIPFCSSISSNFAYPSKYLHRLGMKQSEHCHDSKIQNEYSMKSNTCLNQNDDEVSNNELDDDSNSDDSEDEESSKSSSENNILFDESKTESSIRNHISNGSANCQLLKQLFERSQKSFIYFSRDEKLCLQLAFILKSVNAPLHTYDKVMNWSKSIRTTDLTESIPLETLIQRTARRYGLEGTFPQSRPVLLPSGNHVPITKFCFVSQLFSLLSDETLMRSDNLIFGNDPLHRFEYHGNFDHVYNDIETSDWYLKTQRTYCGSKHDVLVPIIIFIDKTQVKGKNTEPISFTLGIFKRNVRRNPISWRNFGLIPGKLGDFESNDSKLKKSHVSTNRIQDWHAACEYIMSDFATVQKESLTHGIEFQLFGKHCYLRLPIMFVIGDIEGHDKLCSRKASHNALMNGVTHSCKIQRCDCGHPEKQSCNAFVAREIRDLQIKTLDCSLTRQDRMEAISELNSYGFHNKIRNSFFELDYGDSFGGLHTACGVCLMHTFKQRFPTDIIEITINLFGSTSNSVNAHTLNRCITRLVPYCHRQSDRSFPKEISSFYISFLNPKYVLSANEKYARLFPLLWFCHTTAGRKFLFDKSNMFYTENHIEHLIDLIATSISIYQFMSQDDMKSFDIDSGRIAIKRYQSLYKTVITDRNKFLDSIRGKFDKPTSKDSSTTSLKKNNQSSKKKGTRKKEDDEEDDDQKDESSIIPKNSYENPCQFPKFHYLSHIPDQIKMFGSTNNFNGDQCESNHKYISKATGSRTQGRTDTFDFQTSQRFASHLILDKAMRHLCLDSKKISVARDDTENECKVHKNAAIFHLIRTQDDEVTCNWNGRRNYTIGRDILDFVNQNIFKEQKNNRRGFDVKYQGEIFCFTTLKWKGHILRAHPSYRGEPWFDFVNVRWGSNINEGKEYVCPSKIKLFLKIENHPTITNGIYFVARSTDMDENKLRPKQRAYKKWKDNGKSPFIRYWTFEENDCLIHVQCIESVCYIYPDFDDIEFKEANHDIAIEVRTLPEWGSCHGKKGLSWSCTDDE